MNKMNLILQMNIIKIKDNNLNNNLMIYNMKKRKNNKIK